jgi:hypothetical protein
LSEAKNPVQSLRRFVSRRNRRRRRKAERLDLRSRRFPPRQCSGRDSFPETPARQEKRRIKNVSLPASGFVFQ